MPLIKIYGEQKEANKKSVEALKKEFLTIRSGKVSTAVLDNVKVDYYGTPTPINQVATVLATDATTIAITPWEKPMLKEIEAAINSANIGVNPNSDGEAVKLFFPAMTSEQRAQNAKIAKKMGDNAKVSIRNNRKDANNSVKKLEKDKEITQDDAKKANDEIQKITDAATFNVDELVKTKENELMKI